MENKGIVKDQIEIKASVEKVWEVLTQTKYYKQWDELPEDFTAKELTKGNVIEWEGYSKMTVVEHKTNEVLKLSLFLPKVKLDSSQYDVSYGYYLTEKEDKTVLTFEIGDFSPLPNTKDYVKNTEEFVETAKKKIKSLAENY